MIKKIIVNYFVALLKIRVKPRILQMPVTSRCNSRCKTCNVWKVHEKIDIDVDKLKVILKDPFFSKLKAIGINGGEITLMKNVDELVSTVLQLSSIEYIHFISNGLLPERLLKSLAYFKEICSRKNVKIGFTLSVDGIDNVHEDIRGIPGSFTKIRYLLGEFVANQYKYCDNFSIGCTISRFNIPYIKEIEAFFDRYNFYVEYHLAVPNKRIHTFDDYQYYVLNDERSRLLATEFFYSKYRTAKKLSQKMKYFAVYYFLRNHGKGRLCQCDFLYRDVTIDESLNLSLCATASDFVGNLDTYSATLLLEQGKIKKEAANIQQYCDTCIHYAGMLTLRGILVFVYESILLKWSWFYKYKFLVKW